MASNYKKTFVPGSRKPLDSSSCSNSFHTSLNGYLMTSMNLNHLTKTRHPTPSRTRKPNPNNKSPTSKITATKKNKSSTSKTPFGGGGDRFMAEKPKNFDIAHYLLQQWIPGTDGSGSSKPRNGNSRSNKSINNNYSTRNHENSYSRSLTENVLGISELSRTRVLSFMKKPKIALEGYENALQVVYLGTSAPQPLTLTNYRRVIPKSAERVLDAPGIVDDFYLNVLDWSKINVVGIGLKDQVYLWNADTTEVLRLPCDIERGIETVCAVKFLESGSHIITSVDLGVKQLWDIEKVEIIRNLHTDETHHSRIAAVDVHSNLLVSGNRLGTLRFHDLRSQNHEVATLRKAHTEEICGVKWSADGRFCATGGNDNTVHVWDSANLSDTSTPVCSFTEHSAAIKALCWSPSHRSVLASGGGANDRTIKIWNVSSGRMLRSVDVQSQVSGLFWHEGYREIVSSHGNHIASWKYPEMKKVGVMTGHTSRILSMALSPDETRIASVSSDEDETLRFWRVFPPTKTTTKKKTERGSNLSTLHHLR